jgi:crotonobetainyl-CoA:carnitine CoA-transferase CaiB-like acyl-CoA transferase
LVSCSVTGFGSDGPLANRPAFDIVVQAMGGGMALTGTPDGEPMLMGLPVGDCLAGLFAAHGVLGALLERTHTNRGRRVEVSMLNSQIALLSCYAGYYFASGVVPAPLGSRHPQNVPARAFRTRDGYIVVYAALDDFFQRLCDAIERPHLATDARFRNAQVRREHREELERELSNVFQTRGVSEWEVELSLRGVPVGPVYNMAEILKHPHVLGQDMVLEMTHPVAGQFRATGNPVKVAGATDPRQPPPLLGEHTRAVLARVAGYDTRRIDELVAAGAARAATMVVAAASE